MMIFVSVWTSAVEQCRCLSLAPWRMAPSARQKVEKKGKNGGVGSFCALADGGKGINRSCLFSLSGRASLGRQEGGDGRHRQEGWQMVSLVEGRGGSCTGAVSGWSSLFAQEVCSVCPLPALRGHVLLTVPASQGFHPSS